MKLSTGALEERNDWSGDDDDEDEDGLVDDCSLFIVQTPLLVPLSQRDDRPGHQ